MKNLRHFLQSICIFFLFQNAYSSDFSSFISYDSIISLSIGELKQILNSFKFKDLLDYQTIWEYRQTGSIFDSYLTLNSFNLTDVKLDDTKFHGSFNPFLEIISTGNSVMELTYEFKYIGRTTYFNKLLGNGTMKVSFSNL